jgi:hypothetical protein
VFWIDEQSSMLEESVANARLLRFATVQAVKKLLPRFLRRFPKRKPATLARRRLLFPLLLI